jgi:hypothetical protein
LGVYSRKQVTLIIGVFTLIAVVDWELPTKASRTGCYITEAGCTQILNAFSTLQYDIAGLIPTFRAGIARRC